MGITHEWNGSVLTITSDSGTSSMDLLGPKGDMGIRGPQGVAGEIDTDIVYTKGTPPTTEEIGAVPTDRKINNKELNADITLTTEDVGAVPVGRKVNDKPLSNDITLTAEDVGAFPASQIADYIIEQGTSGDWSYRKYASGDAECWAAISIYSPFESSPGVVHSDVAYVRLKLPFWLGGPRIQCSGFQMATWSSYIGMAFCVESAGNTYAEAYMNCSVEASESRPCRFDFYVKGTWK